MARPWRAIRYGELPKNPRLGVMLWCAWCVEAFSARRSDYFAHDPSERVCCGECQGPLALVQKVIQYKPVSPAKAEVGT